MRFIKSATENDPKGYGYELSPLVRSGIVAVLCSCAIVALIDFFWVGWLGPDKHYDFFGIWSFARFIRLFPAEYIYQVGRLQDFQRAAGTGFTNFYPCPYPPSFLICILWLGHFPIGAAKALWTAAGLAMMACSCRLFFQPPTRNLAILATLLAPAALLNGILGETGYFTTSFLIAGFAWLPKKPVLAGIAFGLLTLKPQLGVLVPFALLARGEWKAILSAGVTATILIGLSGVILPLGLWKQWPHALVQYQALAFKNQTHLTHLMATIDAALLCLHASSWTASIGQILASSGIVVTTWYCFQRATYRLAVAALLAGTALAAPHAFAYDTCFISVALVLAGEWMAERRLHISLPAIVFSLTLYLLPLGLGSSNYFIYAIPEVLVFLGIARLALASVSTKAAIY